MMDKAEKEINESILLWVEATLKNVPEHFKYFRDKNDSEVFVFLPRHLRVRVANALAHIVGTPGFHTEETLTEPIVLNGWRVMDGYENLLVVAAVRYAGMDPRYTIRVPIPNPDNTVKTTLVVEGGGSAHTEVGFMPFPYQMGVPDEIHFIVKPPFS